MGFLKPMASPLNSPNPLLIVAGSSDAGMTLADDALTDNDIVFIHIEAPDEAGHNGNKMEKVQSIEQIDEKVVGPVMKAIKEMGEGRILVSPDHPTPIQKRTHTKDPVPFILWGTGVQADKVEVFTEAECSGGKFGVVKGHQLI